MTICKTIPLNPNVFLEDQIADYDIYDLNGVVTPSKMEMEHTIEGVILFCVWHLPQGWYIDQDKAFCVFGDSIKEYSMPFLPGFNIRFKEKAQ